RCVEVPFGLGISGKQGFQGFALGDRRGTAEWVLNLGVRGNAQRPVKGGGNVFRANRVGGREGRNPVTAAVDGATANAGPCREGGVAPGPVIAAVGTEAG